MHLLSFKPSVTKFNLKSKWYIDYLKIKDTAYLLWWKVLKYKIQDESKKYEPGDFRCIYFNLRNNLSKTHWELYEDLNFLKIEDFFGFPDDDN